MCGWGGGGGVGSGGEESDRKRGLGFFFGQNLFVCFHLSRKLTCDILRTEKHTI